jgi:hypothetical protein
MTPRARRRSEDCGFARLVIVLHGSPAAGNPGQEGVVAPERLVVLVDAPRSVEFDEQHAGAVAVGSRDL